MEQLITEVNKLREEVAELRALHVVKTTPVSYTHLTLPTILRV